MLYEVITVIALRSCGDHLADVFAVLDDRIAVGEISERNFVPDGDIVIRLDLEVAVVFRDDAQQLVAGFDAFDDDDTYIVAVVMH